MSNMECLHPEKKVKRIIWKRSKEKPDGEDSAENCTSLMKMEGNVKKRPYSDLMTNDFDGPCMMSLLPLPNLEKCYSGAPVVLTGTACKGPTGPPVGVVDIGVSRSAYYFRIALPGVKKDPGQSCFIDDKIPFRQKLKPVDGNCYVLLVHFPNAHSTRIGSWINPLQTKRLLSPTVRKRDYWLMPYPLVQTLSQTSLIVVVSYHIYKVNSLTLDAGDFNCEIEKDGKVLIRGVTSTGGRTVSRYSRVFEMKIQQQCPSGAFTVSFNLPGPVDPRMFSPNFRSDGIFEAVVVKFNQDLLLRSAMSQNFGFPRQEKLSSKLWLTKSNLPHNWLIRIKSSVYSLKDHFAIIFTLAGHTDPKFLTDKLSSNGVLEGAVLKHWIARFRND
ncbi:putative short-chain dehydrogenase/reductase family 42E member 1-like [Capsicum annuum]|nr:putative short-chain dehydrogenase/reductase family 42E member 1-like [Capsicum annuum]